MGITFELNTEILTPVVSRLLGDNSAKPTYFEIKALKPGAGNPTSLGVYRVSGSAATADGAKPFSVVVKHLADGRPIMDASGIDTWNYYLREIDFFESELVSRLPAGLDFPAYLGQTKLEDGTYLFWNGDLGDIGETKWTWDDCLHAARMAARVNSVSLENTTHHRWLNRDQFGGWLEFRPWIVLPSHDKLVEAAEANPDTAADLAVYGKYLLKQVELNQVLQSQRQVFSHGDFNLNNLVPARANRNLISLDWQLVGSGAIGGEIASIFNTAFELGVIEPSVALLDELCEAYQAEFNALNPEAPVTMRELRLVAATQAYTIQCFFAFIGCMPEPDKTEEENNAKYATVAASNVSRVLTLHAGILDELGVLQV